MKNFLDLGWQVSKVLLVIGFAVIVFQLVGCASIPQEKQAEFVQACSGNAVCIVELEDAFLEKLKEAREYKLVEYQQLYLDTNAMCLASPGRVMLLQYDPPCVHRRNCIPRRMSDSFSCIRRDNLTQ